MEIGPTRREYLLTQGRTGEGSPFPLVVFLHGSGATAAWSDDETGWSQLAQREGFALAIPQALPRDPEKPPKFLTNPTRWNDHNPNTDDIAFLAAAIDDAVSRTAANPRRVFVSGFSNGAGMTFRVATELTDRIAAIAPVAGHCSLPEPKPAQPVPTLYIIGSVDP